MKINRLFILALSSLALFASCGQKDDPTSGEASLSLKSDAAVTVGSETQTVDIEFVTNRDWTAKCDAEWVSLDPAEGEASSAVQKVSVIVLPNTSYDRTATITLSIGVTSKKVTLTQTGSADAPDGTKEKPFDVAAAVAKCQEIGETVSTEKYYVKGIISFVKSVSTNYGNADFYITDNGEESDVKFYCFQCLYLGGEKFTSEDQIKAGDEVIVYGPMYNYKGNTPETGSKGSAYIYSLNGQTSGDGGDGGDEPKTDPTGTGTEADPFNAAAANAKCVEVGQTASTEDYYVKGKISRIVEINTSYGNATFYLSDDGSTTLDQFSVYRALSFNGEKFSSEDQLKVGDEVVVKGKLINYYGNTPQMNQGGQLVSLNGGQDVPDYISISVKSQEVSSEAGSIEVSVSSNQTWTVASDSDFVTVAPASGEGEGTVKVSYTANEGSATRTAAVTFTGANGSTAVLAISQLAPGVAPMTEITWTKDELVAEWGNTDKTANQSAEITLTKEGYTIVLKKASGSSNPYGADGILRAYAKNTIEISSETEMTEIVIVLSDDAKERYCKVTADSGTVADQASGDTEVKWTGSAKSVTFTMGDKADYGSDGATKAGQLRFNGIKIR